MTDSPATYEQAADPTLITALARRVHDFIADESVYCGTGRVELVEHRGPRRVVWIWAGGSLSAKRTLGARVRTGGRLGGAAELYEDNALVEAHIGAESQAAAEALWLRVLGAVRAVFGSLAMPEGYEWITETSSRAANIWGGQSVVIQQFTWRLGVELELGEAAGGVTTIKQVEHTCNLVLEPNTTAGE